jgi:ribulose-phosphate 3-epimerase
MEIFPSIAAANQSCLKEEVIKLGEDIIRVLHVDIEDGNFVPNITFGLKTLKDLREFTKIPFSVHLLVTNPEVYVEELNKLGVDEIIVHIEACSYPRRMINLIRDKGIKVGLAVNPKTPVSSVKYYLAEIDSILIVTSEPDGKDQNFIYQCLEKVRELSSIEERSFKIEVDGGIKGEYLKSIWKAGADIVVMGRAIFNSQNPRGELIKLKDSILNLKQGDS